MLSCCIYVSICLQFICIVIALGLYVGTTLYVIGFQQTQISRRKTFTHFSIYPTLTDLRTWFRYHCWSIFLDSYRGIAGRYQSYKTTQLEYSSELRLLVMQERIIYAKWAYLDEIMIDKDYWNWHSARLMLMETFGKFGYIGVSFRTCWLVQFSYIQLGTRLVSSLYSSLFGIDDGDSFGYTYLTRLSMLYLLGYIYLEYRYILHVYAMFILGDLRVHCCWSATLYVTPWLGIDLEGSYSWQYT